MEATMIVAIVTAAVFILALVALSRHRVPDTSVTQQLSHGDSVHFDTVSADVLADRVRLDCRLLHPAQGRRRYSLSTQLTRPDNLESLEALEHLAGDSADVQFTFNSSGPTVAISTSGHVVTYGLRRSGR